MSPLFEDGDVGIVDPAWPIRVGDMVEIKFKKFGDIDTKLLPMMKRLIEPLPPPHEWDENHMVVVEALNPSARWSCTLDLIESVYRVRGPVIPLPNPGFEHWNPVAVRRHIETLERLLNSPANETSEADAETLRTVQAGYREFLELIGQKCIAPADR